MPGKLRRAVLELANAVYVEHASRNEPAPHKISKYLASTRAGRVLFEAIEAELPLNNISR